VKPYLNCMNNKSQVILDHCLIGNKLVRAKCNVPSAICFVVLKGFS
jgi:hypothetical protein